MRIRHAGIVVNDLEAAVKRYQAMGFYLQEKKHETWNKQLISIAKMSCDGEAGVELIESFWWKHTCVEVSKAELKGFKKELGEMFVKNRPDHTVYYMSDPDGNVFELYYKKGGD